jgi:hypothetical protein
VDFVGFEGDGEVGLGVVGFYLEVTRPTSAQLDELSVDEIAERAAASRGGTILKVPRLVGSLGDLVNREFVELGGCGSRDAG